MPRRTLKLPSYRLHRKSGQAVVTLNGRDHYLGKHGTEESRKAYERTMAQWLASHGQLAPKPAQPQLSISSQAAAPESAVVSVTMGPQRSPALESPLDTIHCSSMTSSR